MDDYAYSSTHDLPLTDLAQLDLSKVRLLWCDGWRDGPLSGMCLYGGERLYFDLHTLDTTERERTYVLYRLDPARQRYEEHWHALFVENVDEHADFDENNQRRHARLKPRAEQEQFYQRQRREYNCLDFRVARPVGWIHDPIGFLRRPAR